MDSGGLALEELGFRDLFAKDGCSGSMDLDALSSPGLADLDSHLSLQPLMLPGHLVATALRSHQETTDLPLTVTEQDIRPLPQQPTGNNTATAAAGIATNAATIPAGLAAAPPQFTIKPLPARKTVAVKPEPQPVEPQQDAAAEFDTDSTEPAGRGGAKRRRRIRNAKQQELNRLAQQRYRERRKQKYSSLQGTVDELSSRISQLNTLEVANSELQQRNTQLEVVVKDQQAQLQVQKETITRQAQQLQTQAVQLSHQAKQLQAQVQVIQQQDKALAELRSKLAVASSSSSSGGSSSNGSSTPVAAVPDADQLNDQIALAVRAVLTGVSSMASVSFPPAKDSAQMQQMVAQLPDALLQQIRTCCREVALHLKKTEVKEQPHAISVPCC